MPLQTFNFASPRRELDYSGIANLLPNFLQGYNAPLERKLLQQQAQNAQFMGPFNALTGAPKEYASLLALQNALGKEHPIAQGAERELQNRQMNQLSIMENRGLNTATILKRAGTQTARIQDELREVDAGFYPGTNYSQPIVSPEEQRFLKNQLTIQQQNVTSDAQTRQRLIYADNIEKTISAFNPEDLVQYSGVAGQVQKKIDQGKSLSGKEVENYTKYEDALTQASLLASQIRQFYGESISPSMRAHLEEITNPESWRLNPKVALSKFKGLQKTLNNEIGTFYDVMHEPRIGIGNHQQNILKKELQDQQPDQFGYTNADYEHTAKIKGKSVEEIKKLVRESRKK